MLSTNYHGNKGKTMQKQTRTCSSDSLHSLHCIFSVCSPSLAQFPTTDFMHQLSYLNMLTKWPVIYMLSERERMAEHMQGIVSTFLHHQQK